MPRPLTMKSKVAVLTVGVSFFLCSSFSVILEGVFLFHRNFNAMGPKFRVFERKKKMKYFFPQTRVFYFYFTGILTRWDQNSGFLIFFFFSHPRGCFFLFHRNFNAMGPKFILGYRLSLQLGLGWLFVIASREANDGVVPLTCCTFSKVERFNL
jgi:hypothetical protein